MCLYLHPISNRCTNYEIPLSKNEREGRGTNVMTDLTLTFDSNDIVIFYIVIYNCAKYGHPWSKRSEIGVQVTSLNTEECFTLTFGSNAILVI